MKAALLAKPEAKPKARLKAKPNRLKSLSFF